MWKGGLEEEPQVPPALVPGWSRQPGVQAGSRWFPGRPEQHPFKGSILLHGWSEGEGRARRLEMASSLPAGHSSYLQFHFDSCSIVGWGASFPPLSRWQAFPGVWENDALEWRLWVLGSAL